MARMNMLTNAGAYVQCVLLDHMLRTFANTYVAVHALALVLMTIGHLMSV